MKYTQQALDRKFEALDTFMKSTMNMFRGIAIAFVFVFITFLIISALGLLMWLK